MSSSKQHYCDLYGCLFKARTEVYEVRTDLERLYCCPDNPAVWSTMEVTQEGVSMDG